MANKTSLMMAALLSVGACSDSGADEALGRETGPCIASQCFDGLSCRGDLCVADDDNDGIGTSMDPSALTSGPASDSSNAGSEADGGTGAWTTGLDSTASDTASGTSSSTSTTGASASASASSVTNADDGVGFIDDPTGGGYDIECSIWDQDCPAGEKCNAWASDGGSAWNATACFPVAPSPDGVGQSCTVDGSGVSGIDTCVEGAICWDVDGETNVGECVAYCSGSPAAPQCSPGTHCAIANNEVLAVCVPQCHPLLQDCPAGQGCYGIDGSYVCAPDASGGAEFGDPCEFINACSPGYECGSSEFVNACAGSIGCCTPFCDASSLVHDCPGIAHECVPVYEVGQAPPGYEDVGMCGIPS